MLIGTRKETVREKYVRHMNEAKENVEAWKNELSTAKTYYEDDIQYQSYCEFMIQMWENTLQKLEAFMKES